MQFVEISINSQVYTMNKNKILNLFTVALYAEKTVQFSEI